MVIVAAFHQDCVLFILFITLKVLKLLYRFSAKETLVAVYTEGLLSWSNKKSYNFPNIQSLKRIHALTIQANYELHIDMEDFENSTSFAQYASFGVGLFSVDPDEDGYPLTVTDYSGTADTLFHQESTLGNIQLKAKGSSFKREWMRAKAKSSPLLTVLKTSKGKH
ncbi:hypothetical protein DNTS_024659 [Danionella cerebrum]|uniref:Fibrinogen C-terminal domain-containing protein n=1 Tax=Danionella cerebrum TaxID=2873325 RepID=A0A553NHS5_9TELE|nr:hypothetical protein DNTS_024659 [Danionella translucida]